MRTVKNTAFVVKPVGYLVRFACIGVSAVLIATAAKTGGWVGFAALGLAALTALLPASGVLVLAGLLPLGSIITGFLHVPVSFTEVLVLSFLGGAALGCALRRFPHARVLYPALLLMLLVVASYAERLPGIRARLGPADFRHDMTLLLTGHYLSGAPPLEGLQPAAVFVEGLAVFVAAFGILATRQSRLRGAARMLATGGAAAAALNVFRLFEITERAESTWKGLLQAAHSYRINVHYSDVNAAGSFFAMMLFIPIALAIGRRRGARTLWIVVAGIVATALWLTSSRAALIAVVLTAAIWVGMTFRDALQPGRVRLRLGLVGAAALAVAALVSLPNRLTGPGTSVALEVRRDMALVSVQLVREHPVFGVGVGQFFDQSAGPLRDLPSGQYYFHENAHNNFLQVCAELGLTGGVLFIWLFGEVGRSLRSAVRSDRLEKVPEGFACALGAFAITALLGHPLLTAEVAYPFYLVAGVAAATGGAGAIPVRKTRWIFIVVAAAIAVSIPIRGFVNLRAVDLEHVGYGLSGWRVAPDGTRYRTTNGTATVFVPTSVSLMDVPLRLANPAANQAAVDIMLNGRPVDRVFVNGREWAHYKFIVPSGWRERFVPLTLRLTDRATVPLQVGKLNVLQGKR